MKFIPAQLVFYFQTKTAQRNLTLLIKFFAFLLVMIALYSVFFHLLMLYEGRNYSWITGIYWTLTVMSTLGFGDITFHTDIGLLFTLVVLISGVVFLLIMLPFSFIQFFYAPWLEAQTKVRTPRVLAEGITNHVIITNFDPITIKLMGKFQRQGQEYVLIIPELQRALELHDQGYKVVVGEVDDPDTYLRIRVEDASLIVVTNDDMMSTNISFTVRGITTRVPIVTGAHKDNSFDILNFPGNTHVFLFMRMLGTALAERVLGIGRVTKIVSSFEGLSIAEIPVAQTRLGGILLVESQLRPKTGVTVVGLLEKGRFESPHAKTLISNSSSLLLAGSIQQLDRFEELFCITESEPKSDKLVLILGGGRVGLAAAQSLVEYDVDVRIVEKRISVVSQGGVRFIQGDAADREVLHAAGIEKASTVLITTRDDATNIYLTFYCRQLRPDVQIISRATNERSVDKLHMAGADSVMSYASMGASSVMKVLHPDEILMVTEGVNFFSRVVPKSLVGKTLEESNIRQETGCSVVAVKFDNTLLVGPEPTVPLGSLSELILVGDSDAEKLFGEIYYKV